MAASFLPKAPVVVAYPKVPEAFAESEQIVQYLRQRGCEAPQGSIYDEQLRKRVRAGDFDLLIALGGDGTMLRAGHLCAPCGVPILGINMGRLGFLIQVERSEWREMFEKLWQGEGWLEERLMLQAAHLRADEAQAQWQALNEVVVGRGLMLRPVRLDATVDGRPLTTFVCDGLIASTPTGSTAYALAAGGPILPPDLRNILLVPIAPHLSVDRAVVLAEGSSVSIRVRSENSVISVDGQTPVGLEEGDRVEVRAAEYAAHFVRFGDPGYFYRNLNAHLNQPHL
ncbi:MAG TPA: NAD(+)/NADH kinase [Anaerolineales bacterium]|nr:NAD(+)/NADH kinase [Anaerolineales bacterium]